MGGNSEESSSSSVWEGTRWYFIDWKPDAMTIMLEIYAQTNYSTKNWHHFLTNNCTSYIEILHIDFLYLTPFVFLLLLSSLNKNTMAYNIIDLQDKCKLLQRPLKSSCIYLIINIFSVSIIVWYLLHHNLPRWRQVSAP